MKAYLFDSFESHKNLLPLSFTRPVALFRIGILTILGKWQKLLDIEVSAWPAEYLRSKFAPETPSGSDDLFINGSLLPTREITAALMELPHGHAFMLDHRLIAFRGDFKCFEAGNFSKIPIPECFLPISEHFVEYVFDITRHNIPQIESDFRLITCGRISQPLDNSNKVVGNMTDKEGNPLLFIEEGAEVVCATINLTKGPVYIGKNAEIMEGATVRGPLALCESAKIRMGARVYAGCTFGPFCKVGGEIDHSVIFGYSNKAHDGYLGDAVVGEWCNIGAGVNASNLKNDYTKIRVWNYLTHTFMRTDLQFCGPIIGDHTKIGVNCMLNTATVLGVGVNIHGSGFPRVFIPSFSEGTPGTGFTDVSMKKFFDIASRSMARRDVPFTESDREIFERIREVADTLK